MDEVIQGRYEPREPLPPEGEGGVVRALDLQHGREVVLQVRPCRTQEERDALASQTRIWLALEPHPGLPTIRDAFVDEDRHIVVVDRVEGRSLADVVHDRKGSGLPFAIVLNYLEQIASALEHLHRGQPTIVHGDVRPANLAVTPAGRVVFTWVGPWSPRGDRGEDGTTSPYRAPEVAAGAPASVSSDVFGLGATAFTLLTGRPPGRQPSSWEGLAKGDARMLQWALTRALSPDPTARPASPAEFVARLRARLESSLPSGTVTLLMTDVEGSTRLWDEQPDVMGRAMARHNDILTEAVERWDGRLPRDQGEGDSMLAVFSRAGDAVACALDAQRKLAAEPWPEAARVRVRMALHTGEADIQEGNYHGVTVNRCARIRALAHGSQTLLSHTTADLVRQKLPSGAALRDLGTHRLKDLSHPERVFQLSHPDLPSSFPQLRSLGGPGTTSVLGSDTA